MTRSRTVALACCLIAATILSAAVLLVRESGEQAGTAASGSRDASSVVEYSTPPTEGFAGSDACVECHAEIAESYATHPMAQSFRSIEQFDWSAYPAGAAHRVNGGSSVLEVRCEDGHVSHHELLFDQAGDQICDTGYPMSYVIGSGQRALAFLQRRGDALFMSPVNWYARSQSWGLAPSYRANDPRRFDRRVVDQCLACHAGRIEPQSRRANAYSAGAFVEMQIGCEKCHGPGAEHIAFQTAGKPAGDESDPIINPAKLSTNLRDSVCYQCHLQGVARVRRPQRSEFDFRPGQSYEDIWTVMVADTGVGADGRTHTISHVTQMRDSLCFKKGEGTLGCISCHDPHRLPTATERVEFYRSRCLKCHTDESCRLTPEQRHGRQNSCIDCHMPALNASNVSHVSQTDHRIVRFAGQSGHSEHKPEETGASLQFFDASHQRLPEWEQARVLALGSWTYFLKRGQTPPASLTKWFQQSLAAWPDDADVLTTFAALQLEHSTPAQAFEFYQSAIDLPGVKEAALEGCLRSCYRQAKWNQALQFADELLAIEASSAGTHAMRADALWNLGRSDEAVEAARQAVTLNPLLIQVHEWLIDKLSRTGQPEAARRQERLLQRIQTARPPKD
ncbi:hypothetical protein GC176_10700 [bacterium]|nr:hypothetical protein [bacterium]